MNTIVLPIYSVGLIVFGAALLLVPGRFQTWGLRSAKGSARRFIESPLGILNFRFCGVIAILMGGFQLWVRFLA